MAHDRITATVKQHSIALPPGVDWPDGMMVHIEPVGEDERPSVWDVLKKYDGIAKDLPPDFAENHDHYIHGQPKRA